MKNYKLLKKPLAILLAVAVVFSAFGTLSLFTFAATNPDDLTATFDFETNDQLDSWVQVGGKTGNETTEGYESWNYDPQIGSKTGYVKHSINVKEIESSTGSFKNFNIVDETNSANNATVEGALADIFTSNTLQVKPYLYNAAGSVTGYDTYVNKASSSSNVVSTNLNNTSMYTLAQTMDGNKAKDTLVMKSVSGRFSLDINEEPTDGQGTAKIRTSPVLVYYYKDADNWRGVRFNAACWNTMGKMSYLTKQAIICEGGKIYQEAVQRPTVDCSTYCADSFATNYNQYTQNKNYTSTGLAMGANTPQNGLFPILGSAMSGTAYLEWLNFEITYSKDTVVVNIIDGTGVTMNFVIGQGKATLYGADGSTATADITDLRNATFALGASYSIGKNRLNSTEQPTIGFDNIKVEMMNTADSNTAIATVTKLINEINSDETCKAASDAYENLTTEQKARVINANALKHYKEYFYNLRVQYDFSEESQKDIIGYDYIVQKTSTTFMNNSYTQQKKIHTDDNGNYVRLASGYLGNGLRTGFYIDLPANARDDIESLTITVKNGFVSTATPPLGHTNNGDTRFEGMNDREKNSQSSGTMSIVNNGGYGWTTTWNTATVSKIGVDLGQTFSFILKPNAKNANSTDISVYGYKVDSENNPTNELVESASITYGKNINNIMLCLGMSVQIDVSNIDIKYKGWESIVHMTPEEEAMAERVASIGEVTLTNASEMNTTVSAIRADFDALDSANLQTYKPEGSELTVAEMLALKEEEIAVYLGQIKTAQDFVDEYSTVINYTAPTITTRPIAAEVKVAYDAYNLLAPEIKSILNNNYGLVGYSFAIGTTLTDVLYPVAEDVIPTAEQLAFENHYETKAIGNMTTATINLSDIDTALSLYDAIGDRQDRYTAEYKHISEILDGLFVVDGGKAFTYDATKYAQYASIYNYFKDSMFTVAENGRKNNDKVINPDKFESTYANSMTLAYDYGTLNASNNSYLTYDLFNIFPSVNKIDTLENNVPSTYLFQYAVQANKATVYVDGENVASSTNKKNVIVPKYCNDYSGDPDYNNAQYYGTARSGSAFSTGEVDGTYLYATSKYVNALDAHPDAAAGLAGYYQENFDRLCITMEYETFYNPQFTSPKDGGTYKRTGIRVTDVLFWYEDSSKDGTEGNAPFTLNYAKNEKGAWVADSGTSDYLFRYSTLTAEIGITYTEDKIILPQLYIGDTAISHLQYVNVSRAAKVEELCPEVFEAAKELSDTDVTETLADTPENVESALKAYEYYNKLSSAKKATMDPEVKATFDKVIRLVTPKSNGSTLTTDANTRIGFAATKPVTSDYEAFGVAIASYNTMVANGQKDLTNGIAGSKTATKFYGDDDTKGDEIIFTVSSLFDSEDTATATWGKWLVARFFTVYKKTELADGIEFAEGETYEKVVRGGIEVKFNNKIVNTYSMSQADKDQYIADHYYVVYNDNAFIDGNGQNNNPAGATAINSSNVLIRSVNGILAGACAKLYSYKDDTDVTSFKGASYVDMANAEQTTYTNTTFADAMASTKNGKLSTAVDTLYLIKAYKNVLSFEAQKKA